VGRPRRTTQVAHVFSYISLYRAVIWRVELQCGFAIFAAKRQCVGAPRGICYGDVGKVGKSGQCWAVCQRQLSFLYYSCNVVSMNLIVEPDGLLLNKLVGLWFVLTPFTMLRNVAGRPVRDCRGRPINVNKLLTNGRTHELIPSVAVAVM